ncbi:MAG: hypothetical protein CMF74_09350 [Maricaulis sp.]|jgi:hypothetical protein|nr:hypothetical protein [Maricaulis sp.]HAQ34368.1 hypothetical protein [Alphaproteobacteria bacterium]|tara:strand:- start:1926 stop:2327 length:402 start_codon:yes stop_codon:yes gene_type:complete
MSVFEIAAIIAAVFGSGLGLYALIKPEFGSDLTRLKADPARPGGYAEFRATLGGMMLMLHIAYIAAAVTGFGAVGAAAVLSAGWGGAALGRIVSVLLDADKGVRVRHTYISIGIEVTVAAIFAAPVVRFMLAV